MHKYLNTILKNHDINIKYKQIYKTNKKLVFLIVMFANIDRPNFKINASKIFYKYNYITQKIKAFTLSK